MSDGEGIKGFWDILFSEDLLIQLESDIRFISSFKYIAKKSTRQNLAVEDDNGPVKNVVLDGNRMPVKDLSQF